MVTERTFVWLTCAALLGACGGATSAPPSGSGTGGTNASSGGSGRDTSASDGGSSMSSGSSGSSGSSDAGLRVPKNHRASPAACATDRAPGDADPAISVAECTKDADCTAGSAGRCLVTKVAAHLNHCSYDACYGDADCAGRAGAKVCACRGAGSNDPNVCVGGDCLVDADCGAGGYYSPSVDFDKVNFGVTGYCASMGAAAKCAWDPNGKRWACSNQMFLPP